jgi:hypothetical protein
MQVEAFHRNVSTTVEERGERSENRRVRQSRGGLVSESLKH